MIVAIDGPAASGKSTVARAVARLLGLAYLDTGAMYRALAVEALRRGVALDDAFALTELARTAEVSFESDPATGLPTRVFVDGRDVTGEIRSPEADRAVSPVSATPGVREAMVEQQRRIAAGNADTVLEGRDIGTVVFPDAEVKVFLSASAHERAVRRARDMDARGEHMDVEQVESELVRRDTYDSTRDVAPLRAAEDAVPLDTTGMSVDQVVAVVAALIEERR